MKLERPSGIVELWRSDQSAVPYRLSREEFVRRYPPVIASFSRNLAIGPGVAEKLGEKIVEGFFSQPPVFAHRCGTAPFREYLKACTTAVLQWLQDAAAPQKPRATPQAIENAWNPAWEGGQVRRAMEEVRENYDRACRRFRTFECRILESKTVEAVANELHMSAEEVEQATSEFVGTVRRILHEMKEEEG